MKSEHHSTTRRLLTALAKDTSETETDGAEPHVESIPPSVGSGSEASAGAESGSGSGSGSGVQPGLTTKPSSKRAKVARDPDQDRSTAPVTKKTKKVSLTQPTATIHSPPYLSATLSHTHTHTRTQGGRSRAQAGERELPAGPKKAKTSARPSHQERLVVTPKAKSKPKAKSSKGKTKKIKNKKV